MEPAVKSGVSQTGSGSAHHQRDDVSLTSVDSSRSSRLPVNEKLPEASRERPDSRPGRLETTIDILPESYEFFNDENKKELDDLVDELANPLEHLDKPGEPSPKTVFAFSKALKDHIKEENYYKNLEIVFERCKYEGKLEDYVSRDGTLIKRKSFTKKLKENKKTAAAAVVLGGAAAAGTGVEVRAVVEVNDRLKAMKDAFDKGLKERFGKNLAETRTDPVSPVDFASLNATQADCTPEEVERGRQELNKAANREQYLQPLGNPPQKKYVQQMMGDLSAFVESCMKGGKLVLFPPCNDLYIQKAKEMQSCLLKIQENLNKPTPTSPATTSPTPISPAPSNPNLNTPEKSQNAKAIGLGALAGIGAGVGTGLLVWGGIRWIKKFSNKLGAGNNVELKVTEQKALIENMVEVINRDRKERGSKTQQKGQTSDRNNWRNSSDGSSVRSGKGRLSR